MSSVARRSSGTRRGLCTQASTVGGHGRRFRQPQPPRTVGRGAHSDARTAGPRRRRREPKPATRLQHAVRGPDGAEYPKGTAIPQRADFNTLDNPFFWTAHEGRDRFAETPAAGLHFVVFNPTSDDFRRMRAAMDGALPSGKLGFETGSSGRGFNSILTTTHRQNFLVPPRARRSFPLSDLRS